MQSLSHRQIWVALGLAAQVALLSCSPSSPTDPGQTTGQIRVTVTTTGTGQPSSFTVRLDGGSSRSIDPNGSVTYSSLAAGNYEVALSVASNCTVSGSDTRMVGVQEGATSSVAFSVTCSAVPTGAIGATTSTTGSPIDPDGYTLTVDGGAAQAVGVNGTRLIADLVVGDHEVELGGVAANCQVQGENPRTLAVTQGQTTQTQFDVVCSATTGLIRVTVTTTGDELDPDGYSIDLDGTAQQTVDANGSTTFSGVLAGAHTLTLTGEAANCTATSENPVSADVVAGQTIDVNFTVECAATVGDLDVSAATTGSQIDPDGYSVSVDGGAAQSLAVDGTVGFPGLAAGDHQVQLSGVASNCSVAGDNPRTVTVLAGGTVSTQFDVSCSSTVGAVEVRIATTGAAIDADGYSIVLDGGTSTQLVAVNDTVTFGGIAPGDHQFALQNVADNCSVTTTNPATVSVTAGATATLDVVVTCAELTGEIQVNMTTTGTELDPNSYTVTLDGGGAASIGINGNRTFPGVVIGDHDIEISGVATNCAVQGANPRTVTVTENATTQVDIDVVCSATTGQVQVSVTTSGDDIDPDGYTVNLQDGGIQSRSVASNGSTTFTGVSVGSHTVTLTNLASNCTVTSANPTSTSVTAGSTSSVSFTVSCVGLTGNLQVTTSTTGEDIDPNDYTVSIDGGTPQAIGTDETKAFLGLADGNHTVLLDGLASNCSVSNNPRTVNVPANGTTSTTFSVSCAALKGDLQVTTTTSGPEPDTNGYTVSIDGGTPQAIGNNATQMFLNLDDGNHTVLLGGIKSNCSVSNNPRTVNVPANGTGSTTFAVTCVATVGTIAVTTSTSGPDADDAYTVTLDGSGGKAITGNGSTSFTSVSPGSHDVELTNVAGNCTVSGANPRSVSVTAGNTTNVSFTITCTSLTGGLQVTTSTSGSEPDTNGYTVSIDGGTPQAIGNNATQTFNGLSVGDHSVLLGGIKSNCSVSNNPRTVSVPSGSTASTTFTVTCSATTGTIHVTTSTSGQDVDNSYTVTLDGGGGQAITGNGSTDFTNVSPGSHDIELTNVASNCTISETNPQNVSVTAGNTTNVSFTITCTQITGDLRVIASTSGSEVDPDGYTVTVGGEPSRSLGTNDTTTFVGIADGVHSVELSGVAGNCNVSGSNPRNVNVPADGQISTTFSVTCSATTGTIAVDVSTSGSDLDPDGYTVTLDGSGDKSVGIDGSTSFTSVSPGSHDVALTGVASNCSISETNPQNVSVTAGNTTNVSFTITCTQIVGSVQVSATTTGSELDTQYTVTLSGGQGSKTLAANGSTTFTSVPVGGYTVTLSDIASNCTDNDGDNQEAVTVTENTQANVSFSVTCDPTTGTIRATTTTTGAGTIDPDGYMVDLDGGSATAIAVNDTVFFDAVTPGSRTVNLSGNAANCSITTNPLTPTVVAGDTASADFQVTCN